MAMSDFRRNKRPESGQRGGSPTRAFDELTESESRA